MPATSTYALSSLEAMLQSLMRGSAGGGGGGEGGGGGGEDNTHVDDSVASPPLPPLPARPMPRGRRPSRYMVVGAARPWTPPPPSSPSPLEQEDAMTDVSLLVEELERKAVEAEVQLRQKEEENAALKRRIESYHVRWLEYEIKIKSLEEAFHEQVDALQMAQDAARQKTHGASYGRRESSESHMKMSEEPSARLRHGRDDRAAAGARRGAASRLGAELRRRQSHALGRGAAALAAEAQRPWQPAAPSANSVDGLAKLEAQFRAWKKDYKARLRKAKAGLDMDRRRRVSCWI